MTSVGWIKLFRKITDWEWYRDGNTFRVFIHLLVTANHEPKKWRGVMVNRGQVVTGRKALMKSLSLSDQEVRTALKHLKSTSEITIESTNKYSIVTLVNYEEYQKKEDDNNQLNNQQPNIQSTSNQPASNQQVTTNKNIRTKECKNDKKKDIQTVIDFYNFHRGEMPRAIRTNDQRSKRILKLIDEYGLDDVLKTIRKACNISFLQGHGSNKWKGDFDFIINPNKFLRIMEGSYKGGVGNDSFNNFHQREYAEEELWELIDNR